MKRILLTLLPALLIGCLTSTGSRVGHPPMDRDYHLVYDALHATALKSFEAHLTGDGWVPHRCLHGSGGNSHESHWNTNFACQKPTDAPIGPVWQLPVADYPRILTPVRADVIAAVRKTGVEITAVTEVEMKDAKYPTARFEISYLRRGGEVAGSVEGVLGQGVIVGGDIDKYTDLVVTLREWIVE